MMFAWHVVFHRSFSRDKLMAHAGLDTILWHNLTESINAGRGSGRCGESGNPRTQQRRITLKNDGKVPYNTLGVTKQSSKIRRDATGTPTGIPGISP